jgi:hypothetical protein
VRWPRQPPSGPGLSFLAHLAVVAFLFADTLFGGRLLYFRDISLYYFPNYVFLARSLSQGVWPLWNPDCDAGAPFLMAEPLELLAVYVLGPQGALRLDPPFRIWLAMCGTTLLARSLGQSRWAAWAAGACFGLSGPVLSTLNLFELLKGVCWGPFVLVAYRGLFARPTIRRAALLGLAVALQVSTLSAEAVLQTALLALLLTPRLPDRRDLARLVSAGTLALALAMPAILGAAGLIQGTRRAGGLSPAEALAWSAHPATLAETLVPRLFGDVHTFSRLGFWGQPFFPDGYPYLLSLYLGLCVLLLVARAGPSRLHWAVGLGILLALGHYGPLEPIVSVLGRVLRTPVKHLLLSTLALCLLAGRGLDRARSGPAAGSAGWLLPGALVTAIGCWLWLLPSQATAAIGRLHPLLAEPGARLVLMSHWPEAFVRSGAMALGLGLVLWRARRFSGLCGVLAVVDLLAAGSPVNPTAPREFYELGREVREVVDKAARAGLYRFYSIGAVNTPSLKWSRAVAFRNSDVWLFSVERQSLFARTHVLDGLQGAFDEDRVGWAPPGSTLDAAARRPERFREQLPRLRLANVRWALSFAPLPEDLVRLRGAVRVPGLETRLGLYEIKDPLPRAFWVPRAELLQDDAVEARLGAPGFDPRRTVLLSGPPPAELAPGPTDSGPATVEIERLDPHSLRLRASSPPGFIVVLEGHHRDWQASGPSGPAALLRANGRYWALSTPGGEQEYLARFVPAWRPFALAGALLGLVAFALLVVSPWGARPRAAGSVGTPVRGL